MNSLAITASVGNSLWCSSLYLNVEILASCIHMIAHGIVSDLVCELWREIRKKSSQSEFDLTLEVIVDGMHLYFPFNIRFTNDEYFEKDLDKKIVELETKIVNDLSRLSLSNYKFKRQN